MYEDCTCTGIYTHTCRLQHTPAHVCTDMQSRTCTQPSVLKYVYTQIYIYIHTFNRTKTHRHACSQTYILTHIRTNIHSYIHTYNSVHLIVISYVSDFSVYEETEIRLHIHTCTRMRPHTFMHTYTHTQMHTLMLIHSHSHSHSLPIPHTHTVCISYHDYIISYHIIIISWSYHIISHHFMAWSYNMIIRVPLLMCDIMHAVVLTWKRRIRRDSECARVYMCTRVCVCVYLCVRVCERERERERNINTYGLNWRTFWYS